MRYGPARFLFTLCIAALFSGTALSVTPQYSITDIGPGAVYALNNRNQAVGSSNANPLKGWLWEDGVRTDLGSVIPRAINDSGVMAGTTTDSVPIIFTKHDRQEIHSLPLGGSKTFLDINNTGDGVGHGTFYAWEYHNGEAKILGNVLGQLPKAMAINNRGQILVHSGIPQDEFIQIFDPGPGRDHPRNINVNGQAYDMNDAGQVVGRWRDPRNLDYQAFVWQNDTMQYIEGPENSEALSINEYGQVVGGFRNFDDPAPGFGYWHGAFMWQNGVFTDLQTILPAESGWDLESARRINDLGTIVGTGRYRGEYRSYMLKPLSPIPEPSTLILMISAGLAVAMGRVRTRV